MVEIAALSLVFQFHFDYLFFFELSSRIQKGQKARLYFINMYIWNVFAVHKYVCQYLLKIKRKKFYCYIYFVKALKSFFFLCMFFSHICKINKSIIRWKMLSIVLHLMWPSHWNLSNTRFIIYCSMNFVYVIDKRHWSTLFSFDSQNEWQFWWLNQMK